MHMCVDKSDSMGRNYSHLESQTSAQGKHLNIEKLTALFVEMPTHYLVYGYMRCDTNILKMHMCANTKKT